MMGLAKTIGKREFIQHTSKYIKWLEQQGTQLVITHHNLPDLLLQKIKVASLKDLRGTVTVKVIGDVNESVLPGYKEISVRSPSPILDPKPFFEVAEH